MIVRTSAPDYARDGIFLNAVDTGWVTDEDPAHLAERKAEEHAFSPPLDIVDGAARIVAPIFDGFRTGTRRRASSSRTTGRRPGSPPARFVGPTPIGLRPLARRRAQRPVRRAAAVLPDGEQAPEDGTMQRTRGWVAAAIVAAGCGACEVEPSEGPTVDDDGRARGPGCGLRRVQGHRRRSDPAERPDRAVRGRGHPGVRPRGGPGLRRRGRRREGAHPVQHGPAPPRGCDLRGSVDTILSCSRTDGVLTSTFSGVLESGGRFTVVVTDGGEPADDTISLDSLLVASARRWYHGNLQVHELDRCEPPCGEGMCWCEQEQQCEPCDGVNEPPPVSACSRLRLRLRLRRSRCSDGTPARAPAPATSPGPSLLATEPESARRGAGAALPWRR